MTQKTTPVEINPIYSFSHLRTTVSRNPEKPLCQKYSKGGVECLLKMCMAQWELPSLGAVSRQGRRDIKYFCVKQSPWQGRGDIYLNRSV